MSLRPCLSVLALSLAAIASTGCGSTTCFCGPTQANPLDADSNEIVQAVNLTRTSANLSTVAVCKSLNVSAAGNSDTLRDSGFMPDATPAAVHMRACAAKYEPACADPSLAMGELVAEGNGTGAQTYMQWSTDPTSLKILTTPGFVVVGVGHSIGADNEYWTLDLASQTDASCN